MKRKLELKMEENDQYPGEVSASFSEGAKDGWIFFIKFIVVLLLIWIVWTVVSLVK